MGYRLRLLIGVSLAMAWTGAAAAQSTQASGNGYPAAATPTPPGPGATPGTGADAASMQTPLAQQPSGTSAPPTAPNAAPSNLPDQSSPNNNSGSKVETVTVTGTRLRNPEFTSSEPIQTINAARANLEGFTDISEILQSTTVAGNGTQINNEFTGFVVNGGPGVNTVGLRGTSPDRTLILLDGKRLGPAGTQSSVGAVDLNTLPDALIDHIDIVKDGSSSIYGSDAVEGIINVVTRKNFDGGQFKATTTPTQEGGGNQTDITGAYGKTFSRGYITVSGDFYRQDILRNRDRSYLNCERPYATDPTTGASLDLTEPNGSIDCTNILSGDVIDDNTGLRYLVTPGTGNTATSPPGLTQVNCTIYSNGTCNPTPGSTINVAATRANHALESVNTPLYGASSAVSPVSRYTGTISAAYDLVPKFAELYTDQLFNRRTSNQDDVRQIFPVLDPANPSNPVGPGSLGDYGLPVIPTTFGAHQAVDYYHGVVGLRGDLPNVFTFKNWRYDLSGVFSRSDGSYSTDFIYQDRINATTGPSACDVNYVNPYVGGNPMATQEPGVACMPINWAAATQNNGFSNAEKAFLTGTDTGHTIYEQGYVEGDFNGDVVQLPAGTASADVGFHLRRDRIKDTPGPETLAGNSFDLAGAGITEGAENVGEVFGELGVPIVKDLPLVKLLTVDISGRYSHYSTAGDAKTYKANVTWAITDWLSVKYDQGTSFRAPALFEIYQAASQGFLSQTSIDPCINYTQANATIAKNCAAAGIPPTYMGANSSSALVTSSGGGAALKPETSFSKTVGIVLRPHIPFGITLGAEVDYYENTINNTITQFGANNIVDQCYNQTNYPNGYCNLFTRNLTPGSAGEYEITNVSNNYLNVGQFIDRGMDLTIHASAKLPYDVRFLFDSYHSWTFQETTELLPGTVTNSNGTVGTPRYVGNVNFTFIRSNWTFNWFTSFVAASNDDKFGSNVINNFAGTGVTADILTKYPFYSVSNLAIMRAFPQYQATLLLGLNNVFNKAPPPYSNQGFESVIGSTAVTSQYDLFGRAIRVQFQKKF